MNCPACSALLRNDASVCVSCGVQVISNKEPIDPLLGQILDNKYIVKRFLGGGGFGSVYLAEEPSLDRKVAIKTLHSQHTISPMLVGRFQREGMAASKLEHPCAVRMFNYGKTASGIPWLAMEFLEGETLGEFLEREGPLSTTLILAIFVPLCEVLEEAHERGIIHRDLKPDNIMLVSSRGKLQPKLLDFGIAALLDDPNELTKTGVMSGTPTYMPPEQWEGLQATDARSDIYSLGFILYQCLAGQLPFTAESTPAWIRKHCLEEPLALSLALPGVSAELSAVVMKAIEKKPGNRYRNMAELRFALMAAIQPESNLSFDSVQTMMAPILSRMHPTPSPSALVTSFEKTSARHPPQTQLDDGLHIRTNNDTLAVTSTPERQTLDLLEEAVTSLPGALVVNTPPPLVVPVALRPPMIQPPLAMQAPSLQKPAVNLIAGDPSSATSALSTPLIKNPLRVSRWWFAGLFLLVVGVLSALLWRAPDSATLAPLLPSSITTQPAASQGATSLVAATGKASLFPTPKRPGRFWTNEDGTVTDSVTKLTWAARDNGENVTYEEALTYLAKQGAAWRMPTASELKELYLADIRKDKGALKLTGYYQWADHNSKIELDYDCLKKKACFEESWALVIAFNNGTIFRNRRSVYNGRVLLVQSNK
jgi:serine/threonine protein kinase